MKKNNFDKVGSPEEYLQNSQNLEQLHENTIKNIKITINLEKEPKKLFYLHRKNKLIYSKNNDSIPVADFFSFDYLDSDQRKKIEQHLNSGKILKCHHKNCFHAKFSTLYDYNMHCHNSHPKQPLHPKLSLIELLQLEPRGNPWESVDQNNNENKEEEVLKEFDN